MRESQCKPLRFYSKAISSIDEKKITFCKATPGLILGKEHQENMQSNLLNVRETLSDIPSQKIRQAWNQLIT